MPISEKILKQVEHSKANEDEKNLMLELLRIEDKGSFRYSEEYERLIKTYIEKHKEIKE